MTRVKVSTEFYWPLESDNYRVDYSKAKKILGWKPKSGFRNLVKIMAKNDIDLTG